MPNMHPQQSSCCPPRWNDPSCASMQHLLTSKRESKLRWRDSRGHAGGCRRLPPPPGGWRWQCSRKDPRRRRGLYRLWQRHRGSDRYWALAKGRSPVSHMTGAEWVVRVPAHGRLQPTRPAQGSMLRMSPARRTVRRISSSERRQRRRHVRQLVLQCSG